MNQCEEYIENLAARLPAMCTADHLIQCGLVNSRQSAAYYRKNGKGPSYIKIGGRFKYPKGGIVEWLRINSHECH